MAQDFERAVGADSPGDVAIGTSVRTILTSNSDDALIGIRLSNIVTSTIKADIYITSTASGGSADSYIVKNAPIASGGVLKAKSDTADSLNVWVSFIDTISS